jgi:cyclase
MCRKQQHHHQPHHHHHHDHTPAAVSRRQMLTGLGVTGLLAVGASPTLAAPSLVKTLAPAPPAAQTPALFQLKQVTKSVYAALARPQAMLNCNAAVIVNSDHVLVVDSHSKPSAARALIGQIRQEITDKPVRYVVNSHFHWDHAQGNLAYPTAFKNAEIVSSTATREWLAREGAPRLQASLAGLPKQIAELRAAAEKVKTQANDKHKRLMAQIAELEAYAKEMTPPPITLPTVTFDQRLVLHRDGKEIHLLFLGRGHTAGDVVVYIPSEKVVATGDLMHGVLPYIADGYPDEWPRTLRALEELDFNRLSPGHGSVQEGKTILANFRGYLEEINEAVARGVERGDSLAALQQAIRYDQLRSLQANGNGERIVRELVTAFDAPAGPESPLKGGVASNVADMYNYYTKRRSNR